MNELEKKLELLREKYRLASKDDKPIILRQAKAIQYAIEKRDKRK